MGTFGCPQGPNQLALLPKLPPGNLLRDTNPPSDLSCPNGTPCHIPMSPYQAPCLNEIATSALKPAQYPPAAGQTQPHEHSGAACRPQTLSQPPITHLHCCLLPSVQPNQPATRVRQPQTPHQPSIPAPNAARLPCGTCEAWELSPGLCAGL